MGTFSIWHWIVVLVIVVLVFGTKKLRNLGHDLGGAIKGFKEGMKDANTENSASDDSGTGSLTFDDDRNSTANVFEETTQNAKNENHKHESANDTNEKP